MSELDPHGYLTKVHPALVKVLEGASQTPQGFMVVYGLRTEDAERRAVLSGHSQTLHSRHLMSADGLCRAVDVAAITDGAIDWKVADAEGGIYAQVARQIMAAAERLGTPVQWGGAEVGAWTPGVASNFRDWGHYQLPWAEFP